MHGPSPAAASAAAPFTAAQAQQQTLQPDSARASDTHLVTSHFDGLAVLSSAVLASKPNASSSWQRVLAACGAAFQPVSDHLLAREDTPEQRLRLQMAWMLLLLAVRSPANRQLVARLERTAVSPLVMQLEHAERCRSSGLVPAFDAAVLDAPSQRAARGPYFTSSYAPAEAPAAAPTPKAAAAAVAAADRAATAAAASPVRRGGEESASESGSLSLSHSRSSSFSGLGTPRGTGGADGGGGGDSDAADAAAAADPELAMLLQEVALLAATRTPMKGSSLPAPP